MRLNNNIYWEHLNQKHVKNIYLHGAANTFGLGGGVPVDVAGRTYAVMIHPKNPDKSILEGIKIDFTEMTIGHSRIRSTTICTIVEQEIRYDYE